MAGESDRDRLERMTKEKRQAKNAQTEVKQKAEAEGAQRKADDLASDERNTREILTLCQSTFAGFKLEETNHDLQVMRTGTVKFLNVEAKDSVPYVVLYVHHIGADLATDIPLVAVRCRFGKYEVHDLHQHSLDLESFDRFREVMLDLVSGMDAEYMGAVLNRCRQSLGRRRHHW
jgi:hypothetical protein